MKYPLALFAFSFIALCNTAAFAAAPPDQVVKQATNKLSQEIRERQDEFRANPKLFYSVVDKLVVPAFDQRRIAQLVLGRNWKDASEAQRTRFTAVLKDQLIRTYADTMLRYNDQVKPEWQGLRMGNEDTETTVRATLLRSDAPPVALGFVMTLTDKGWKVYDITVENISLVSSFRGQANAEIKELGIDGFIDKLESGKGLKKK